MQEYREFGVSEARCLDFQNAITEILSSNEEPEQMMKYLAQDCRLQDFIEYINTFDVDMINVASELTKKWAVKQRY